MTFENLMCKSKAAVGLFKWVISIVGEELVEEPREVLAVAPAQAPIAPVTVKAKKRASQSPQKKSQFTGDSLPVAQSPPVNSETLRNAISALDCIKTGDI